VAPQRGQGSCRLGPDTLAAWAPIDVGTTAASDEADQRQSSLPATMAEVE
jgi:hypothetical protein